MHVAVSWVAFPLHPETPEQGRTLESLFAGRGVDVDQMVAQLRATARHLGLEFGDRTMTYNSRRAQELGKYAEQQGVGEAFHLAVFQAYFVHGRNIARLDELKKIAEGVGMDGQAAVQVLRSGRFKDAVDNDWQLSRRAAITAVPTFRMGEQTLVGAQPYDALCSLVQHAQ